jgi:flagellar hook-associated protein 2
MSVTISNSGSSGATSLAGLASGLNTASIIADLMANASQPLTALQNQVSTDQLDISAWGSVSSQLGTLQTAVAALLNPDQIGGMASAASTSAIVAPVVTGSPAPGTTSFTVNQLAAAQESASASTFSGGSALVGVGTFSITVGTKTTNFTTTSGTTLSQLANQISYANIGVSASVVAVNATSSQLVLSSQSTGTANAFTASGTQSSLASFTTLQPAQDALVTIGTGSSAIQLSRSSNQINDLMPGVSLNLLGTSATPVTVTVAQNVTGVISALQSVIGAYNNSLTTINADTAYNSQSQSGGPLMGDAAAQGMEGQLNQALNGIVPGLTGQYNSAASIGISIQTNGQITLNQSTFFSAMTADPNAVTALLSRTGSATNAQIASVAGTDMTQSGSYGVAITQAAAQASETGAAYAAPSAPQTFTIASGGETATVNLSAGDTETTAIGEINNALQAAGITTITAQDNGSGAIQLQDSQYGSAAAFTVSGSTGLGLDGTFAGTDVAGTINGQAATGSGQILSSGTGASTGLTLQITSSQAEVAAAGGTLSLGNATLTQGIMGQLSSFLNTTLEPTGTIAGATNSYNSSISDLQTQETQLQSTLTQKQKTLEAQFSAMETALAKLQAESQAMTAYFGSGGSGPSSSSSSSSSSSGG